MRKRIVCLTIISVLLSSCATGVAQFREAALQACDLHTSLRPDIVAVKPVIAAGFNTYPPKVQESLLKINAQLPKLDAIGKAACAFASPDAGVGILKDAGISGWDVALKILKGAAPVFVRSEEGRRDLAGARRGA